MRHGPFKRYTRFKPNVNLDTHIAGLASVMFETIVRENVSQIFLIGIWNCRNLPFYRFINLMWFSD